MQAHRTIELCEIPIECTERQVPGLSGDLQHEAVGKAKSRPFSEILGSSGYYIGVPCKLGERGLEQILEIKLTPEEDKALRKSADSVKELCAVIGV